MARKVNDDIRILAKEKSIFLWQIAMELGISEPTFLRWLRVELPKEKKERIITAIKTLAEQEES